jgi:hypothetical protein
MTRAFWAPMFVLLSACGEPKAAEEAERQICRRAAEAIGTRLNAHDADRERLDKARAKGVGIAGAEELAVLLAAYDMKATFEVGRELGKRCLSIRVESPCRESFAIRTTWLDEAGPAFAQLEQLQNGIRGAPPCGRARDEEIASRGVPVCALVAETLHVDSSALARAQGAWPLALDERGLVSPTTQLAAESVSRWRAMVDIGLALLPACRSASVVSSCSKLRDGLQGADPSELVDRVSQLGAAFREGAACTARSQSP